MDTPATRVIDLAIDLLKPYARNARTHSKKQIKQIAASIERLGFNNPVLVSDAGEIIAGHGRVESAKCSVARPFRPLRYRTCPQWNAALTSSRTTSLR